MADAKVIKAVSMSAIPGSKISSTVALIMVYEWIAKARGEIILCAVLALGGASGKNLEAVLNSVSK